MLLCQDFGAKFTKRYLEGYLTDPIMVPVKSVVSSKKFEIRMKMAKHTNSVMMTSEWGKVVERYKIEQSDIVLFNFKPNPKGGVKLCIVPLRDY